MSAGYLKREDMRVASSPRTILFYYLMCEREYDFREELAKNSVILMNMG